MQVDRVISVYALRLPLGVELTSPVFYSSIEDEDYIQSSVEAVETLSEIDPNATITWQSFVSLKGRGSYCLEYQMTVREGIVLSSITPLVKRGDPISIFGSKGEVSISDMIRKISMGEWSLSEDWGVHKGKVYLPVIIQGITDSFSLRERNKIE